MHYNSNKSKGYEPLSSGPNMTGYYMGESPNLMTMMQTGGRTTAGGAALARVLQMKKDQKRLESAQRKEAKRQKKGGLFGSVGGFAGGLLGAALAPVTGGASLAIGTGLGTALGKRVGEGLGAGKSINVDRTGTVFGQQSFRDVEQASRDYTRDMGKRALSAGLDAAKTSLNPLSIYGVVSRGVGDGPLKQARGFFSRGLGVDLPKPPPIIDTSYMDDYLDYQDGGLIGYENGAEVIDLTGQEQDLGFNVPDMGGSSELMDAFREADVNRGLIMQQAKERILGDPTQQYSPESVSYLKQAGLLGMTEGMSKEELEDRAFLREQIKSRAGLDAMVYKPTLGIGDIVATESLAPKELRMDRGSLTDGISGLQAISTFTPPEQSTLNSPRFLRDMLALVSSAQSGGQFAEQQNGGLIGMQNGGFTAEEVLRRQGLEATPEQLALFESFDPSGVGKASQQLGQGLLGMTAGQGLSSGGGGFGAQQSAIAEAVEGGQKSLEDQIQDETTAYQSQVMGTAADIVAGDGEFKVADSVPKQPPTSPPTSPLPNSSWFQEGADGRRYVWTGSQWNTP